MGAITSSPIVLGSLVVTVVSLLLFVRAARRELPVRVGFDVARIVFALVAVVAMAAITKVTTPIAFIIVALAAGGALGYARGRSVTVRDAGRGSLARINVTGIALWGAGIVVMQISAVLARTGALKVGQALAYLSVAMSVGLLIGRNERIQDLQRLAVAGGVAMTAGFMVLALPMAAAACCVDENGPEDEGSGSEHTTESTQSTSESGQSVQEGGSVVVVVTPQAPASGPSQPRSEQPQPAAPAATAPATEEPTAEPELPSGVMSPTGSGADEEGDAGPANPGAAAAAGAFAAAAVGATAVVESKRGRKKRPDPEAEDVHPDFLWFPRSTSTVSQSSPLEADPSAVPVAAPVAEGAASGPTAASSTDTEEAFEFVDKLVAEGDPAPTAAEDLERAWQEGRSKSLDELIAEGDRAPTPDTEGALEYVDKLIAEGDPAPTAGGPSAEGGASGPTAAPSPDSDISGDIDDVYGPDRHPAGWLFPTPAPVVGDANVSEEYPLDLDPLPQDPGQSPLGDPSAEGAESGPAAASHADALEAIEVIADPAGGPAYVTIDIDKLIAEDPEHSTPDGPPDRRSPDPPGGGIPGLGRTSGVPYGTQSPDPTVQTEPGRELPPALIYDDWRSEADIVRELKRIIPGAIGLGDGSAIDVSELMAASRPGCEELLAFLEAKLDQAKARLEAASERVEVAAAAEREARLESESARRDERTALYEVTDSRGYDPTRLVEAEQRWDAAKARANQAGEAWDSCLEGIREAGVERDAALERLSTAVHQLESAKQRCAQGKLAIFTVPR